MNKNVKIMVLVLTVLGTTRDGYGMGSSPENFTKGLVTGIAIGISTGIVSGILSKQIDDVVHHKIAAWAMPLLLQYLTNGVLSEITDTADSKIMGTTWVTASLVSSVVSIEIMQHLEQLEKARLGKKTQDLQGKKYA
ncbi:MAG: hypothetical protein NTX86_00510 [Candidatus Dependentiae bacterium]|nr:hypothetical protein [Candidatus Dependentiae bacterium]